MTPDVNTDTLITNAQKGSREARDKLLQQFSPFIIKTVSKICGKYVRMGEDDEVSIGLMAFDEAVLSYSGKSSKSFMSYCELVIKHRLIDYFRKTKKNKTIFIDDVAENNLPTHDDIAQLIFKEDLKHEIITFSTELKHYGITFKDLVDCSPKHKDTRENVISICMNIAANNSMVQIIRQKKCLPQKDIIDNLNVSVKILERFRKYIIAVCIIFSGNYLGLQTFIRGGVQNELSSKKTGMRFRS